MEPFGLRSLAVFGVAAAAVLLGGTALLSAFVAHRPEPVIGGAIAFGLWVLIGVALFIIDR